MFMDRKTQYYQDFLPNLIYRFNAIPIKFLVSYFVDINKLILKFIWRGKRPRIANIIVKESKAGRLKLSYFKTFYNATVNKIVYSIG